MFLIIILIPIQLFGTYQTNLPICQCFNLACFSASSCHIWRLNKLLLLLVVVVVVAAAAASAAAASAAAAAAAVIVVVSFLLFITKLLYAFMEGF